MIQKTPRVGLEPTTPRLTAACSTIELSRITSSFSLQIYSMLSFAFIYLQNYILIYLTSWFSLFFLSYDALVKPSTD